MAVRDLPGEAGGTVTDASVAVAAGGVGRSVRRIIVFTLLFVLVAISASGVGDLLGRLLDSGRLLASGDVTGLALSLAFTLIAGPLAALLWWFTWRGMSERIERESLSWGFYLAAMSTVALVLGVSPLLAAASALIGGDWQPSDFATGIAWVAVWVAHHWMSRHPDRGPSRLTGGAPVLGYFFGIVIGAGGAVSALSSVFDAAITSTADSMVAGNPWWRFALQGLVWMIGGALVWWWHWTRIGARNLQTGFSEVVLIMVAALGSVMLALGGVATALYVLLRLAFNQGVPVGTILDPLDAAIASAAVGALIWTYYRGIVASGPEPRARGTRLVTSGVALVAAASGIGVIVNSLLAAVGTPLAETGVRPLLLGGISALVVGGPVWWLVWRPTRQLDPAWRGDAARRVYLIVVFGLSALVAIVTLLLIGSRLFEFALGDVSGQSLLDRVRAPLGLLVATALAAGYHFAIWQRDRSVVTTPARVRSIARVILVTGSDPGSLVPVIRAATGAEVTVWRRADVAAVEPSTERLQAALEGVTAERVLVITGAEDRIDVIALQG